MHIRYIYISNNTLQGNTFSCLSIKQVTAKPLLTSQDITRLYLRATWGCEQHEEAQTFCRL